MKKFATNDKIGNDAQVRDIAAVQAEMVWSPTRGEVLWATSGRSPE